MHATNKQNLVIH